MTPTCHIRLAVAVVGLVAAACSYQADNPATDPVAPPATQNNEQPMTTGPSVTTPTTTPAPAAPAVFRAAVHLIDAAIADRMTSSWRSGCPVPLEDLRLLTISHWGFDDQPQQGHLVVHADDADDIAAVFRALYDARFPIEQIRLVDEFGGDDDRSMAANNTSGFNCRTATGSDRWSEHAFGRAIDINPIQNPYVTGSGAVLPPMGADHIARDPRTPGLITADGPVVAAFEAIGWVWGGTWVSGKDYQHFSATGR